MIQLDHVLVYAVLWAASHWIVARSEIARPLWSRASGWVDKLLRCAGCSGFWLGAASGLGSHTLVNAVVWKRVLIGGLLGAFFTPVFEAVLLWALQQTSIEATPDETSN